MALRMRRCSPSRLGVALIEWEVKAGRRAVDEHMLRQRPAEKVVQAAHQIGHCHRPERVAMIPGAHRESPASLGPSHREPVLKAHLDCHLDRDRPGVGEEHLLEPVKAHLDQPRGQSYAGSCVSPPNITCAIRPS